MKFSERVKQLREEQNLTQEALGKKAGVSGRMIQRYEAGVSHPRYDAAEKIANALGVPVSQLLDDKDMLVAQAGEKYGTRGAKQAKELMNEVTGLFAGGEMAEEDLDMMMRAIQDAYWIAKEKNQKFTRKDYKKD